MADVDFTKPGDSRHRPKVFAGETVAGVENETTLPRAPRRSPHTVQLRDHRFPAGIGVRTRVQFDVVAPDRRTCLDLLDIRVNKQTDFDTALVKTRNDFGKPFLLRGHIEPAFRRNLPAVLRDQANGVRLYPVSDPDDLVLRCHFEVQTNQQNLSKQLNVPILDMTAVHAKMNGDLVRASHLAYLCRCNDVWTDILARLAQRRHMVNINAKFDHRLPLFT